MAKKQKMSRRESKSSFFPYKKWVWGILILTIFLALYCYFTAHSTNIPVIHGPNYPKRTPGTAPSRTKYAVYDQLAASQTSKAAVLLPPEEVPTQLPVWSGDDRLEQAPPVLKTLAPSQPQPSDAENHHNSHPKKASKNTPTSEPMPPKPHAGREDHHSGAIMDTSKVLDVPAQPKEGTTRSKRSNPKESTPKESTPKKSQLDLKQPLQEAKPSMRMQIGSFYKSGDQAHAVIQKIAQKGGFPKGMRPIVQKAMVQGHLVYRVILIGQCPMTTLTAYQKWLTKQSL